MTKHVLISDILPYLTLELKCWCQCDYIFHLFKAD